MEVPINTRFPSGPYELNQQELLSRMKATRPSIPDLGLRKFLENDRRVLRFYCIWDDSTSVFGDLRHMVVNYFLSDDTIEIRESIPPNSGREANGLFLRRFHLPKHLNTLKDNGRSGPGQTEAFYSERDLMIGAIIKLHGRPFVICDCDEFTKNFYRENYGIKDFTPVSIEDSEKAEELNESSVPVQLQEAPSLTIGAEPKEKRDNRAMLKYDGVILRFLGVLDSKKQVDRDRRFVICLHLSDDSISVFEPPARNSGVLGGKFLEQKRLKKLDGTFYKPADFFIGKFRINLGAQLVFYSHRFTVKDADLYALNFMTANADLFQK